MMYPLIFAFFGFQQDGVQQQLAQMQQTLQQVQADQRQIQDLRQSLDQVQSLLQNELKPGCLADVRWEPGPRSADPQAPVPYTLLSTVGAPADACLNAEIRITVNYYGPNGRFVCSGAASLTQREAIQTLSFEFRPLSAEYFFKWLDGATWEQSNHHRLICRDREGIEVREPSDQSSSVKLFAMLFPKRAGLAISETTVHLPSLTPPSQRPPVPSFLPGFR